MRIHHIPWFSFSLLFLVTAHWDVVKLFLAFGVLSQVSILRMHTSTWTVLLEYSHSQCWAPAYIFTRLSLAFWTQTGTHLSCHFLNSLNHQNPREWVLIWTLLSPGFTYQLFSFLKRKYFVSPPASGMYLCGHSHTKHNVICIFSCRSSVLTTDFKA